MASIFSTVNLRCQECRRKKTSHILKIKEDEGGKEYFNHDFQKHVCKPTKVSSIRSPDYVILKRNEINLEKKKMEEEIAENRIVKACDFVLRPNKNGVPDASLFVFSSEDRSVGYKYDYSNFHKHYICCQVLVCGVNAKVQMNSNDEKIVILSKNEHQCSPIKYQKIVEPAEGETSTTTLFELHPNSKCEPNTRLIIYTSVKKDFIHEYTKTSSKSFHYLPCRAKKHNVIAKLFKDENDENYVQYCKNQDHICQPRKYDPKKYIQPKLISSDEHFSFHDGCNGEKDKYLVVFTSEKKDFAYQYYMDKPGIYRCKGCSNKNKWVAASLIVDINGKKSVKLGQQEHVFIENEENGTKSVKVSQHEHVCQPQIYDPKKYVYSKQIIISHENFLFHDGISNGQKNKYLILFINTTEKNDPCYQYNMLKPGFYQCRECYSKKKHFVSAKIIEDKNGLKSLKLGEKQHICQPQKYNPDV
uniref:Uncharacterized protein n=1 Tax=Panagrolaimus sp. ES5 TaxID=591445 RepID=A0AC34F8F2_9BILA